MNRKTLASLSISLGLTLLVMGSLPLAAAESPNAPLGITETPMATETSTNAPTNTPAPTQTPTSAPTNTPTPTRPVATSQPNMTIPAAEATLTPTSTPTATRALVLPITGEPAGPVSGLPEILVLIFGGVAALAMGWMHESTVKRTTRGTSSGGQGSDRSARSITKE
jgi:hypothetical protein